MTNVLLDGFSNYWHRRKSSMKTTQGERPPALRGCPQLRSVPSLWSGIGEQSRSISRGLKINKNSAAREVFLVCFPSYRTLRAGHCWAMNTLANPEVGQSDYPSPRSTSLVAYVIRSG